MLALPTHQERLLPDTERLGKQVVERERERIYQGNGKGTVSLSLPHCWARCTAYPLPRPATLPAEVGLMWGLISQAPTKQRGFSGGTHRLGSTLPTPPRLPF